MDVVESDTKTCPFCGEDIKRVAIRCKHCQADLTKGEPDFNRGSDEKKPKPNPLTTEPPITATTIDPPSFYVPPSGAASSSGSGADDFEQRMLEYAYRTTATINVPSVAHALKLPTALVNERLEEMAARDVLIRDTDDEGNLFFTLPGRPSMRMPASPPPALIPPRGSQAITAPADGTAVAALVLNVLFPGVGSLVAGRVGIGVGQLILWILGIPLCFILIGVPMVLGAWIWSLVTGIQILEESRRRQSAS